MASEEEKRKKREQDARDWEAIRERQRQKNEERRQKSIEEAAAREAQERLEDDFLDREFLRLFDTDAKAAADYLNIARGGELSDKEIDDAVQAIKDAQAAAQGGTFSGRNVGKAKRILGKNKDKIAKGIKAGKKKKGGCLGVLALIAAAGVGTLYGMYEGVSAIASALF